MGLNKERGKQKVNEVLLKPFNKETHKKTFINYLEVIMDEDGKVMYAVPSHQEKMISIVCERKGISRDELNDLCPKEYYFNFLEWLHLQCGCVAVWNDFYVGKLNERQKEVLQELKDYGIYKGEV